MGDQEAPAARLPRRGFVGLVGKGAAVVALGGVVRALDPGTEFIRPPGALPEQEFLITCIRCAKCANACPHGLITPVGIGESVISIGTPRLQSYCSRCRRCIDACSTKALVFGR